MTDKTSIQRIKELDQERATLFEQAKEEALRRANQAVEDLNALGLNYRLVTGSAPSGGKAGTKPPQGTGQTGADKKLGVRRVKPQNPTRGVGAVFRGPAA
jgi:hypothetical protein